jgi:cbb3-type cytochrome oxidase subunit 3
MSLRTLYELVAHFARAQRWFLIPLLLVLLAVGLLLFATSGLAYVAPFVYALF